MLRSMTGFGRGIIKSRLGTITTEIKTLNHRYLDLVIRLPNELQELDARIKESIKRVIHRGRIEVFIERRGGEDSISGELNLHLARSYLSNLKRLERKLNLKDAPSLSLLCRMPGVIELHTLPLSIEKAWGEVKRSIDNALNSLLLMREREGKFIEQDIKKRLKIIQKKQKGLEERLPHLLSKYKEELKTKLAELSGRGNSEKLSTEISILSEKVDVSEELVRFSSHLNQLGLFLNEDGEVGKKIGFTLQEMVREINTMAAKSNDFIISQAVVLIKTELEKIKEQVQNIE